MVSFDSFQSALRFVPLHSHIPDTHRCSAFPSKEDVQRRKRSGEKKGKKKLECVGAEARVTLLHPVVSLLMGLSCCTVRPHPVVLMFDFQTAKYKQGHETSPGMKDGEGRGAGDQEQTWRGQCPGCRRGLDQSGDGWFSLEQYVIQQKLLTSVGFIQGRLT